MRIHDHFHVVSSFCLPSLLSSFLSATYSWLATEQDYGLSIYEIFPARSPRVNTSELEELTDLLPRVRAGHGWAAGEQAFFQLVAAVITLLFSSTTGALVGLWTRNALLEPLTETEVLNDSSHWHLSPVLAMSGCGSHDIDVSETVETIEVPELRRTRATTQAFV